VERKTQTDRQAYYVYAYYFVQKYVLYNLSVIKYLHEKRTIIPENDSTVVDSQERIFAYRRDSWWLFHITMHHLVLAADGDKVEYDCAVILGFSA